MAAKLTGYKQVAAIKQGYPTYYYAIYDDGRKYYPGDSVIVSGAASGTVHTIDEIIDPEEAASRMDNKNITAEIISYVDTSAYEERVEKRKAAEKLGLPLSQLYILDYPDGNISFNKSETLRLQTLIDKISPDAIFIPHKGEGWSDHIEAGNIVREIIRTKSTPIQLYEYCVWFWYYNVWNIDWKNAFLLKMNQKEHQLKLKAIDTYTKPLAPCGKPWSGVLPKLVVKANQWNCELYFKANS